VALDDVTGKSENLVKLRHEILSICRLTNGGRSDESRSLHAVVAQGTSKVTNDIDHALLSVIGQSTG
jgi:hypothetical protein